MKNSPSPSPLFDEFVKTLPPYGDPRDAEIAALRQQLAECERERDKAEHKCGELLTCQEQLATVTKERNELVAALELIANKRRGGESCYPQEIAETVLAKLDTAKSRESCGDK